LHGYLDGIEVTMHFNLEHTIEQLDDDVTNN